MRSCMLRSQRKAESFCSRSAQEKDGFPKKDPIEYGFISHRNDEMLLSTAPGLCECIHFAHHIFSEGKSSPK